MESTVIGEIPLNDDVIWLDVDVTLVECRNYLLFYCDSYNVGDLIGETTCAWENGLPENCLLRGETCASQNMMKPRRWRCFGEESREDYLKSDAKYENALRQIFV